MASIKLKDVFRLKKKVGTVHFSKVVFESAGHMVIPIRSKEPEDRALIKHLSYALNNFLKLTEKSGSRFTGARINDVGKKLENQIVEEIRKTPLIVEKLGQSGYPDFEIKQKQRITYLEIKTTGNIRKEQTHHRMFYYSSGKKIAYDARHLLLQIQMEEEASKYWKVVSWEIRDLSKLKLNLKTEFNASFADFEKTPLLISSTGKSELDKGQITL